MATVALEGTTLRVAKGLISQTEVQLPLDALRIVYLFLPKEHPFAWTVNKTRFRYLDLDGTAPETVQKIGAELAAQKASLGDFTFFLTDFFGHYAKVTLKECREVGIDLVAELAKYHDARLRKLAEWKAQNPILTFTGIFGDKCVFSLQGISNGGSKALKWLEIEKVELTSSSMGTSAATFKATKVSKAKGFWCRMPSGKVELFITEYDFWRSMGTQPVEPQAPAAQA